MKQDLIGIDTNILVYAFDSSEKEKYKKAKELVPNLIESGNAVLSTQNLTEFFFVTTSHIENPIEKEKSAEIIKDFKKSKAIVKSIHPDYSVKAAEKSAKIGGDFWDFLLAETLIKENVNKIITENTDDFKNIDGIEPENPFS